MDDRLRGQVLHQRDLLVCEWPHLLAVKGNQADQFVILLNLEQLRVGRTEVFQALRAENIGVNVHYVPVPWHPYYRNLGYERGNWPVAEDAYERMLSLPIFPTMTDEDIDDVFEALRKVVDAYRK